MDLMETIMDAAVKMGPFGALVGFALFFMERNERQKKEAIFRSATLEMSNRLDKITTILLLIKEGIKK